VAYSEIERQGVMLPVSNVEVEYTGGAGYDELVEVETRVSEVRSRTVSFAYVAKRAETGELLASGSTRLVCTNADGRPRRIPPHLITVLHSLQAADPAGTTS
jgi:acyl-CoA thioester hydrolase